MKGNPATRAVQALVASLIIHAVPLSAQYQYEPYNGGLTITGYTNESDNAIIPSEIDGLVVYRIGESAFAWKRSLIAVIIPDSVTSIGPRAFYACPILTSVSIPPSVTSIESGAFKDCVLLNQITLPPNITTIAERTFDGCKSLSSVTIPASVTSIGQFAFGGCENLLSIDVEPSNPSYASVDGVLFDHGLTQLLQCPSLKRGSYFIPGTVTTIADYAFFGCFSLTDITMPNGVTSIGTDAFAWCQGIEVITIPDNVASIERDTFLGCKRLTAVAIGNSISSIQRDAFAQCESLQTFEVSPVNAFYSSIDGVLFDKEQSILLRFPQAKGGSYAVPSSVTTIGVGAFKDCQQLTRVEIPASVGIIEGDDIYLGGLNLEAIIVEEMNPNYLSVDGVLFDRDARALLQCPARKAGDYAVPNGVTLIAQYAFSLCRELLSITIPASVEKMSTFFYGCTNLRAIDVHEDNPTYFSHDGVLYGFNYFDHTEAELKCCPQGKTGMYVIPDGIRLVASYAFYDCDKLNAVIVSSSVVRTTDASFGSCDNLTGVYFEGEPPSEGWQDFGPFWGSERAVVYYLPWMGGWSSDYAGRPTAVWLPWITPDSGQHGDGDNSFGFSIFWAPGQIVTVETTENLAASQWTPVFTGPVSEDARARFDDPDPRSDAGQRFYRLRGERDSGGAQGSHSMLLVHPNTSAPALQDAQ